MDIDWLNGKVFVVVVVTAASKQTRQISNQLPYSNCLVVKLYTVTLPQYGRKIITFVKEN